MNHVRDILTKAYNIVEESGSSTSPELYAIKYLLLTPEKIREFPSEDLYLALIRTLVKEQYNLSFPEDVKLYDQYYSDCIRLFDIMYGGRTAFDQAKWLHYAYQMFESLKTPYYRVYCETIFTFLTCIRNLPAASRLISDFYGVLIKSSSKKLTLIHKILEHAPDYLSVSSMDDTLFSDIVKDQLYLFASEKDYWIPSLVGLLYGMKIYSEKEVNISRLMDDYYRKEGEFLGEYSKMTIEKETISSYMARRNLWFSSHQTRPADDIVFSLDAQVKGSALSSEFLNTFAYNMNRAEYITNPAIGREQELKDLMLILISPKKSPIITGESGVGKTAIVEGLAWLLSRGEVPDLLKNRILFKLTTTSLLGGTKYVGEMEDRIKQLTTELKEHPEVILFIDEIHTIVGAGSTENSHNDISNMLKPFIDRGDIKIIGATTREEYERYVLPDRALARRFYPINLEEPDENLCLEILKGSLPAMEYQTKVRNHFTEEETHRYLVRLIRLCCRENQPQEQLTRLPELPLSILEMAFSYAALQDRSSLTVDDLNMAVRHSNRLKKELRINTPDFFTL